MLVAIYTKGNGINKQVLFDNELDFINIFCKSYKPKKVWVLDTVQNKIVRCFSVETEVFLKDI